MKKNLLSVLLFSTLIFLIQSCSIQYPYSTHYYFPNTHMFDAKLLALNGKWEEAAEIWQVMALVKNDRVASRAAFNMAVACAELDRAELALLWAEQAAFCYRNENVSKIALEYLCELNSTYATRALLR